MSVSQKEQIQDLICPKEEVTTADGLLHGMLAGSTLCLAGLFFSTLLYVYVRGPSSSSNPKNTE